MPSLFSVVLCAGFCFPTFECKHVCQGTLLGGKAERIRVGKPCGQGGQRRAGERREEEKAARMPSSCWSMTAFCLQIPGNSSSPTELWGMRKLEQHVHFRGR